VKAFAASAAHDSQRGIAKSTRCCPWFRFVIAANARWPSPRAIATLAVEKAKAEK
jgi:hypothetical protein